VEASQAPELQPDAVFTDKKKRRIRAWRFVFSLLLLAGLCASGYLAWQWFAPRAARYGLSILWINGKLILILLPVVLVLLFWLLFANLPRKKTIISLSEDGIRTKNGRRDLKLRWDSLETLRFKFSRAFFLGIPGSRRERVELTDAVGNKLCFDARMDRFEELVNRIRERSFPALYQLSQERLSRAGKLAFGKQVSLSPDSLQIRKTSLPLTQIKSAAIEKGCLRIKTINNRKKRIRVDKLDNPDVLLHLLGKST